MPLPDLLKSAAGTCPFCNQKAGILNREHQGCRRAHQAGWNEMVRLAADAAWTHSQGGKFLQLSLADISRSPYGDGNTVNQALEEGCKQRVWHAMNNGIIN